MKTFTKNFYLIFFHFQLSLSTEKMFYLYTKNNTLQKEKTRTWHVVTKYFGQKW